MEFAMVLTKRNAENWPFQSFRYEVIMSPCKSDASKSAQDCKTNTCVQYIFRTFHFAHICCVTHWARYTRYYCNCFHTHTHTFMMTFFTPLFPSPLEPSLPTLPHPHPSLPTLSRLKKLHNEQNESILIDRFLLHCGLWLCAMGNAWRTYLIWFPMRNDTAKH